MYIFSSLCSKNLGAVNPDPNIEVKCCSLQKVAFRVDLFVGSLFIAGALLAILTTYNVNLGPLNVISALNDYYPGFILAGASAVIFIDVVLKIIQSQITKLLKEILIKEEEKKKQKKDHAKSNQETRTELKTTEDLLAGSSITVKSLTESNQKLKDKIGALQEQLQKAQAELQKVKDEDLRSQLEALKKEKSRLEEEKSKLIQESRFQRYPLTLSGLKETLKKQDKADIFAQKIAALADETWTIEEYQKALYLIEKLKTWKESLLELWQNKGFELSNRNVESLVSSLLGKNLKQISLEELIHMSYFEFSKEVDCWKNPSEDEYIQQSLMNWKRALKNSKKPELFRKILNSVGDIPPAKELFSEEEEILGILNEKRKFLDLFQQDSVEITNKACIAYLSGYLREKKFTDQEIKELISDQTFIPARILDNQDTFTEKFFSECVAQAKKIKETEEILSNIEINEEPKDHDVQDFKLHLARIPFSYRKAFSERYNLNRNHFLLEAALRECSSAKKDTFKRLIQGKAEVYKFLTQLGLNFEIDQLDRQTYLWMLNRFKKEIWSRKISPENMEKMIKEAFNQMILLSPQVQKELVKKREDKEFIGKVMQLEPKMAAQILAAMLLQVNDKDSPEGIAEMHRVLTTMISKVPLIGKNLIENKMRFVLIPQGKDLTDIPGFEDLKDKNTFDNRPWSSVRGIGDHPYKDGYRYAAAGEETLLGGNYHGKSYEFGYSTAAHEFWHAIYRHGLNDKGDLSDKKAKIKALLDQKRKKIKEAKDNQTVYKGWQYSTGEADASSYADSNDDEWGAEFATAFLEANGGLSQNSGQSRIASKEQLKKLGVEEQQMFKIYADILGEETTIPYTNFKSY